MCGRFAMLMLLDELARMFAALLSNDLPFSPNYNICPSDSVSVVVSDAERRLISMRWGFVPRWYKVVNDGPLLINARAEKLAEKSAFGQACRTRRCLIPATGYYEWSKTNDGSRLPWYIQRTDGQPVVFAGIWQRWDNGDVPLTTCAIVTTDANGPMSGIHHRMPVVLTPDNWGLWLGEEGKGAATLMRSAADDALQFHRVSVDVNSNRASGPELIEPIKT